MAIPKLNAYALPTAADLPNNKVYWAFEPERAALLIHDMLIVPLRDEEDE
jgi:bifunctional isochorismate lyase/aryl carrier protein